MAARVGIVSQKGITSGTSTITLIQLIAAANHAVKIVAFGVFYKGTSNTDAPHSVDLARQSDAGTMSSATPVKGDDSVADTLDTTAQHTATAEPTTGDVLAIAAVHPQTGYHWTADDRAPLIIGAGDRIGLRVVSPAASQTVDAYIVFEE